MSCPDWSRLIRQRQADGEDPAGWRQALEHLVGCSHCRRIAFRLDPTLVFAALPEPELPPDEGRHMVAVVRSLRRGAQRSTTRRRTALLRIAAALILIAGALVLLPERSVKQDRVVQMSPAARGGGFSHVLPTRQAGNALVALDSPATRVYEMDTPDMAVVMVIDDELDLEGER